MTRADAVGSHVTDEEEHTGASEACLGTVTVLYCTPTAYLHQPSKPLRAGLARSAAAR
jgi:hypothetical protein